MFIKITKSVVHLGFGYRIGTTTDSLSDEDAKFLVQAGRAVVLPPVKKVVPEEEKEEETKVFKAVVKQSRKRK